MVITVVMLVMMNPVLNVKELLQLNALIVKKVSSMLRNKDVSNVMINVKLVLDLQQKNASHVQQETS